jgi:hypothetical protein
MTVFYCIRFETPPTWRAMSPYLYLPGIRWPSYNPRHWVTFSSPPTTRRATVEAFEPASKRGFTNVNCVLKNNFRSNFGGSVLSLYVLQGITGKQVPYVLHGLTVATFCLFVLPEELTFYSYTTW